MKSDSETHNGIATIQIAERNTNHEIPQSRIGRRFHRILNRNRAGFSAIFICGIAVRSLQCWRRNHVVRNNRSDNDNLREVTMTIRFDPSEYNVTIHFQQQRRWRNIDADQIRPVVQSGERVVATKSEFNQSPEHIFALHKYGITIVFDKEKKNLVTVYREEQPAEHEEEIIHEQINEVV